MDHPLRWRKATASGGEGGNCVEVADLPVGGYAVRDSKNPGDGYLVVDRAEWRAFTRAVQAGQFG